MYQTSSSRSSSFMLMSKLLLLLLLLPSARCSKLWSIQLVQKKTQQGRNSCPRLQFGFQFGLYHVVARLSFLRSISLASLFTSLSIFGWSDLLQTALRRQAAFSFAVLCIIIFNFSVFLGPWVFSDPMCCSFLTWFGHDFPAGQFASVCSFLIAATTRDSELFLLSLVTRFARSQQLSTFAIWLQAWTLSCRCPVKLST